MERKEMSAKELDDKLSNLGYSAYLSFCGVKPDKDGDFPDDGYSKAEYAERNPRKCYDRIDEQLLVEIRKTYDLLLKKSVDENYFFIGANYKTLVKSVMSQISHYNDPMYEYEEEDFIRIQIDNMKFALKTSVIDYTQINETPDFEAGVDSHFLFLNYKQLSGIKRNLEKAIALLENILKNRNDLWIANKIKELEGETPPPPKETSTKTIKDWFSDKTKYDPFIKKLETEGIIDSNFNILPQEDKGFTHLRMKACIGFLLVQKGYLKFRKNSNRFIDKDLCEALNNTFPENNLSTSNYSDAKKQFIIGFNDKNFFDTHLNKLHFIK